jgi:biopolymer transport protein TolR
MIDLPSVGKAAKQPDQIVQIVIGKDESLELKIQRQGPQARRLKRSGRCRQAGPGRAARPTPAVVISADRSVKYETVVVKVMDTLQRAGIQRVGPVRATGAVRP